MTERERILPEDITSEEAVLGTCLIDPQAIVRVRPQLSPEVWTRHDHREVWEAMCALNDRGEKTSPLAVAAECERARPHITPRGWNDKCLHLVNAEGVYSSDLAGAVRRVRYVALQRRAVSAANNVARVALTGSADDEQTLIADLSRAFEKYVAPDESSLSISTPDQLASEYYDLLMKRQEKSPEFIGWKTGIADLDRVIALRPGDLWYVAASPGSGKTAFVLGIADSLAKRAVPVLFASVEQPKEQLMDRLMAADTGIDSWKLAQGDLSTADFQAISPVLADRRTMPLYIMDDGSLTTPALAAAVQYFVARHGVRVVVVDYVQLMSDSSGETEQSRVGYISGRLREIARSYKVCLVAASQLSRQYAQRSDEMPRLTDLRESGRLEQDAAVVLGLRRNATEDPRKAQLKVLKNRHGRTDLLFELAFDPATTRFYSVAREAA